MYLNLFPSDVQLLQALSQSLIMFRNAIQLCHFLSTIEEQTQEEMGTNFQGTVFKAMLAKAVAKRNIEVSGAVSGPITDRKSVV